VTDLDVLREACAVQLDWQIPRAEVYLAYYEGGAGIIALLDTAERQTFRKFLDESAENWCCLVVNAVAERLAVTGWRFGDSSDTAQSIWQASHMNADHKLVQRDALVTGGGYVLVQPDDANPTGVTITAESPLECTVLYQPGSRRARLAGYKRFVEPVSEKITEVLMTPDTIATWYPNAAGPVLADNPAGEVGLFEVVPQPRTTFAGGASELDPCIPIQDRVHTTLFNRCVASDFGAFRQIWASGIKLARSIITSDDGSTTEVAVKPFDIGANRLLVNEDPAGRFGAFPGDGLTGFLAAVQQDIEAMASITRTPAYYFPTTRLVNLSADAIKAAEAGLVAKVSDRADFIGEAWTDVMRLALALVGDPGATMVDAEVIWKDFETRSQAQLADALTKLATIGIPEEALWALFGASPQQIEDWKAMKAAEPPVPAALPKPVGAPGGAASVPAPDGSPAPEGAAA
jgi:hypothetical protein